MPSISTWMSSSWSSRLDEHVDYQGLAGARRRGSAAAQFASISASAPPGRHPMQQTAGCHTCMRPGSHGPLFRSQMWVMVLVGAAPIPQLSHAPRAGWPAAPAYWLSVTPCPAIIARPGWPAVVTPPSAPRSLMERGQVQAYGTCPLQNEHESAPDLVRRIRNGSRLATVGI